MSRKKAPRGRLCINKYFNDRDNEIALSEDKAEHIDEFLKHENIEIRRLPFNELLCKEYIDVSLFLKSKPESQQHFQFLRTMLNIPTRTVANSSLSERPSLNFVKAHFILPKTHIGHDFKFSPIFELNVSLKVDCSNLHPSFKCVYLHCVEPNEVM